MRDDKDRDSVKIAQAAFDSPEGLDTRLNRISGAISDQALYLESELIAANTPESIHAVERRAEALMMLFERIQESAWEKDRKITQ